MWYPSKCSVSMAAQAALFAVFALPATAYYCAVSDNTCIDAMAQVSVSFQFDSISPSPLLFYYAFDGGYSAPNGTSFIKVGYWLQYNQNELTAYNKFTRGTNWTTEAALRVGNLGGYVGGSNNGCDGVWGSACSANLKSFLQTAIFNLTLSDYPYEMPLKTVLRLLSYDITGPSIEGCPATLFQLDDIFSYAFVNDTTAGGNNRSSKVSVAPSGSPSSPWRIWNILDTTPMQQAGEVAVGIITRGPVYGSKPLTSPDDINIQLVCSKAPKQSQTGSAGSAPEEKLVQGFARGIIKTHAFDDDDFDYENHVAGDNGNDNDLEADEYAKCADEDT